MKRKLISKIVSTLLCGAMLVTLGACGSEKEVENSKESTQESSKVESTDNKPESSETIVEEELEELELDYSFIFGITNFEDVPWISQYIYDNLKLTMKAVSHGSVPTTMLASGELATLMGMREGVGYEDAIEAGMLLDLTQFKDQLPNVFENEYLQSAIKYRMDKNGEGTALYMLPTYVTFTGSVGAKPGIRQDIYKAIGYPEITDMDSFLDVMKQMQEYQPVSETGNKMYAINIQTDWDGGEGLYDVMTFYGTYTGWVHGYTMEWMDWDNPDNRVFILDEGSPYKEGLKWLNKAQKMGLVDPDSPAQTHDAAQAKWASGESYFVTTLNYGTKWSDYTKAEDWKGYAPLYAEGFEYPINNPQMTGDNQGFCIAADSSEEEIEAALRFLNWIYSYEGMGIFMDGYEGSTWYRDENGERQYTEEALAVDSIYTGYVFPEGGTLADANTCCVIAEVLISGKEINPETGEAIGFRTSQKKLTDNNVYADFYALEGENSDIRDVNTGQYKVTQKADVIAFRPAMSKEAEQARNVIYPLITEASWKMVYAKDDAEFEAIWDKMVKDCEAADVIDIIKADNDARHAIAVEYAEKYGINQ